MKRALLVLAVLACIGSIASAQTYRPLTGTRVILSTSYPSGNALTLQANPTSAYTLTLPAASPTAGAILRSDPTSANTLIWTSPLDMYVFENGLTESGSNTVKWGGSLTGATTINTAGANAITFYNNTATTSAALTIGGGAGTLTFDVQGGTTINTTGSANTAVGNSNGTFTLLSSTGLNATAAGVISDGDGNLVIADNVEPSVNDNYSLGTNSARWSDVFVGPSTVHIGSTTVGGDELALSYNTTSNTAVFNVGSTNAMELTSAVLTLTANLAANGDVTLGDGGGDAITVNSTSGLVVNTGAATNLTINEAQITRANTLTLEGANGANTSSIALGQNVSVTSSGGGIALSANSAVTSRGTTNTIDAYASSTEFAEVDLTTTAIKLRAEAGATDAVIDVMNFNNGTALITLSSSDLNLESSNITIGDAVSDVITIGGTIAGEYPLNFEGALADAFETRFQITDPTADRTITFPNVDGTVITTGNTSDLASLTWLVGGNTITGVPTTRKIGLAAQATNPDGLAIMTDGTDRLTITAAGAATFSGSLTATGAFNANDNATLGDGADNVSINAGTGTFEVASSGVDISTVGAISSVTTLNMSSTLTNTATSNQIVLGTTNTTTISATAPAASRVYTIPDVLANASFVLTAGAQTIGGAKTFSSDLAVSSNTASTSTSTGALVVTGGAGFGGAVNVGGALDVVGATTLDGNVTLGDGGSDAITVNSTSGLVVNSGATTDLSINETQVVRANTLTIQGAEGNTPANVSSIVLNQNLTLTSSAGGIDLTANGAMETQGGTNTMRGFANGNEYSEVDMTSTAVTLRVENGSNDPTLTVTQSLGLGIITMQSDNFNIESSNIAIGDAASDIATFTATIAEQYPLNFEGATANAFETSFQITDPTADRIITFPDVDGTVITTGNLGSVTGFVPYNTSSASTTADANGTAYLFNVAYDGAATGNALGARIASDATGGTNATATGLTLSAVATGTGTSTGLTVSASGGATNKAINVTAGGIDVDAGGVNVDAGGVTIGAGGLTVTAGLSTFSQGMKMPVAVANAAYVADDDDMVIIQTATQQVTFPAGAAGRVIIVKNTSGNDITLSRSAAPDVFEGNANTITLATGSSQTFIYSGTTWYLIGN